MLLSLAASVNSVPLPPVSSRHGIRLPPPEHCLTNVNFSIVPDAPQPAFGESILQPETQESVADDAGGDASMEEAPTKQTRKRALEEDEDYD